MRHVKIFRSPDRLSRECWQFYYLDSHHVLVLIEYVKSERATPRHKFRDVENWSAYMDRRGHGKGRSLTKPPLPDDVSQEAKQEFISALRVARDFDEARGEK